jgi:hypothetical protein
MRAALQSKPKPSSNGSPTFRSVQSGILQDAAGQPPDTTRSARTRSRIGNEFNQVGVGTGKKAGTLPSCGQQVVITSPLDPHEQAAERTAERFTGTLTRLQLGSQERSIAGGPQPLPGALRVGFESYFGHDFGTVRVHSDTAANQSTRALGAHAFTMGENIYFGSGQYDPGSQFGQKLLAHELAHVVQQRAMPGTRMIQPFWAELGGAVAGAALGALALSAAGPGGIIAGLVVGGLFGGLAGAGLNALFGKDDLDRTEPTDEGIAESDPKFRKKWQHEVEKGLGKLYRGGCQFPVSGRPWRYDERYWDRAKDPQYAAYKPKDVSPAKAIDEMFDNLDLWDFDCALYPEVAWLYGYRHTLGATKFNERFKDLVLRQHQTKGIKENFYSVESVGGPSFDTMWEESPVGTKVMWTNRSPVTEGTAWKNENAIKSEKGDKPEQDRYDAHPLGRKMLEPAVKKGLAEAATDFPTGAEEKKKYIDTKIYRHQLHLIVHE